MDSSDDIHVWVASTLSRGVPVEIRAFTDERSARNWVESRIPTDATWSSDSDMQAVLAIEAEEFDDPPGRIDRVKIANTSRFREKWRL